MSPSTSLTNATKHAPGAAIALTLANTEHELTLTVTDDGPGFVVPDEVESRGMFNMFDRVAAIGGEVEVRSQPGDGTTVSTTVPVTGRVRERDKSAAARL
jgi:signal transduction histidine kinase